MLVIQPLPGIGDMMWHLPHLHAIARAEPEGRVSVLTKPRSQADRLLAADPAVGEVIWLDRERGRGRHDGWRGIWRLAAELRRHRFRKVWLLHDSLRYAMAAWLAGIPERVGYGRGGQRLFLNHPVALPGAEQDAHPIDKADRLLRRCGLEPLAEPPLMVVEGACAERIEARYGALPGPWLTIGVGSSEAVKQWGGERFTRLIESLEGRGFGTLFVVGGPAEEGLVAEIVERLGAQRRVEPVVGVPLMEVAALLRRCALYVGNDTGILNMAAALGVDALGLFGASPPLMHSPHIHPILPPAGREGMAAIEVAAVVDRIVGMRGA
ncbi:glycosyltransferase family 9 protein [Endothiovibrio diazotrophicus]